MNTAPLPAPAPVPPSQPAQPAQPARTPESPAPDNDSTEGEEDQGAALEELGAALFTKRADSSAAENPAMQNPDAAAPTDDSRLKR